MKSLLKLPSKEFVDFIGTVQDYQQTSRLGCTFWYIGIPCFCQVSLSIDTIHARIRPFDHREDIGNGCGNAVEKEFKRDDIECILIAAEQAKFLNNFANNINVNNEDWYFCPFYFKKNKNGIFNVVPFDKIPEYLKIAIEENRDQVVK